MIDNDDFKDTGTHWLLDAASHKITEADGQILVTTGFKHYGHENIYPYFSPLVVSL